MRDSIGCLAAAAISLLGSAGGATATDWDAMIITSDIAVELAGTPIDDRRPAWDNIDGLNVVHVDLGPLPEGMVVDGHDRISFGMELFSVEQAGVLSNGLQVQPADVIRWNGSNYTMEFDGSAHGVPRGVNVDAVVASGGGFALLLSFDATVSIGDITADDEDLVAWNGAGGYSLFFDGSNQGIESALDLDAADFIEGAERDLLLMSFDGSGQVSFVPFADEDVIEFDPLELVWDYAYEPGFLHGQPGRRMDTQSVSAVIEAPEPTMLSMLLAGGGLLGGLSRRRARRHE